MQIIIKYGVDVILYLFFAVINRQLSFKLAKKELKLKYYIIINIILMIFIMALIIYFKKSIGLMLGMYIMFIISEINKLFVKKEE